MAEQRVEAIEEEITKKRPRLAEILTLLERERRTFEAQAVDFAKSWYPGEGRRAAQSQPDIAEKMSDGQIRAMKGDLVALGESASALAETAMRRPEDWWHTNPKCNNPDAEPVPLARQYLDYGYTNEPPANPDDAVRRVLGAALHVLARYGFGVHPKHAVHGKSLPPQPVYAGPFTWTQDLKETINRYAVVQEDGKRVVVGIRKLLEELRKAKAARRWDEN